MKLIQTTYRSVYSILAKDSETRNCDYLLMRAVWDLEMKHSPNIYLRHQNCEKLSALDLLNYAKTGYLSCPETIRRTRQSIQERNEHLRGESYKFRQSKQTTIKNNIIDYGKETERSARKGIASGKGFGAIKPFKPKPLNIPEYRPATNINPR